MLLQASQDNDLESAIAALRAGADINCVDQDGCTPAILAAQHLDNQLFYYLTDQAADLSIVDGFGMRVSDYLPEPQELTELEELAV